MIFSLQELAKSTQEEFESLGRQSHFQDILIEEPGIKENEVLQIQREFPGIPESYIRILQQYNFNGVSIGYFSASPFSYNPYGMLVNLKEANDEPFFPKEFMEKHRIYQVGSCNTDLICVTSGTENFHEGEILFVEEGYDIFNPQDSQVLPLAKDFEQFLIVAANLNCGEINQDRSNYEEKKQEFLERLRKLGVDEMYHSIWLSLF